ncbi:MAG: nucleoside deaminase [Candidatus Omnitrophica bacterium]|nr:nucleoside deaminase [Candidatus Omnitrophota bacterium]
MKNKGLVFVSLALLMCVIAGPVNADDSSKKIHKQFMLEAVKEARKSLPEGVMPEGALLVKEGNIIGRGHNRRAEKPPAIILSEIDCLENAGKLTEEDYKKCVIYTTLSPGDMSADVILAHKIPIVVIGENETFKGAEGYLESRGVQLIDLDMEECKDLMQEFLENRPELLDERLG